MSPLVFLLPLGLWVLEREQRRQDMARAEQLHRQQIEELAAQTRALLEDRDQARRWRR